MTCTEPPLYQYTCSRCGGEWSSYSSLRDTLTCPFCGGEAGEYEPDTSVGGERTDGSALDLQVGGGHYKKYKIQPLEFAQANGLPFAVGSIIKYVVRYKDKNGVQDLEKAKHLIDFLIEQEVEDG